MLYLFIKKAGHKCLGGPQHKETGSSVSTSNASWGGAPTKRNW
ncbi:hypothetical protein [Staphylococcus marylandisciuri]|nr:hypothetical protein [Staphylococcus marylandisciuri]